MIAAATNKRARGRVSECCGVRLVAAVISDVRGACGEAWDVVRGDECESGRPGTAQIWTLIESDVHGSGDFAEGQGRVSRIHGLN